MGKQTDKLTADCSKLSQECMAPFKKASDVLTQLLTARDNAKKLLNMADERDKAIHNELGIPLGADTKEAEQAKLNDKERQKIDKQSEDNFILIMKLNKELSTAKQTVRPLLVRLENKVKEFETFISKKEKSKVPFKSKNSLPDAKKFVSTMNANIKMIKAVLN